MCHYVLINLISKCGGCNVFEVRLGSSFDVLDVCLVIKYLSCIWCDWLTASGNSIWCDWLTASGNSIWCDWLTASGDCIW